MTEQEASKIDRGTTSPKHALEESLGFLKTLDGAYGGRVMSRDAIAEALGHSPSSSAVAVKIGSLTHYGLLRRNGNVYEPSPLAQDVLFPTTDSGLQEAYGRAAKSPALYRRLFADLSGKAIPQRFSVILQRDYGVARSNTEDVAKTFLATAEFAGLLMNGVLYQEPVVHSGDMGGVISRTADQEEKLATNRQPVSSVVPSTGSQQTSSVAGTTYTIPLSKGRTAGLTLPRPIDERDLQRLTQWIALMSDVLMEEELDIAQEKSSELSN